MTAEPATFPSLEVLLNQLKEGAYKCIEDKDYGSALPAFKKIVELEPRDINARYVYAQLIDDGSHKKRAQARDLMLSILDEHPAILDTPTEGNLGLIRNAAALCSFIGPFSKSIELFRKAAHASNNARDYFLLSEILTQGDFLEESIASLERQSRLIPPTIRRRTGRRWESLGRA